MPAALRLKLFRRVGTDLVTSRDVPFALSVVYKLVETEFGNDRASPKTKFSEEKVYWPGRKQVFRYSSAGKYHHDLLACAHGDYPAASPLLEPVMRSGRRLAPARPVMEIRQETFSQSCPLAGRLSGIERGASLASGAKEPGARSIARRRAHPSLRRRSKSASSRGRKNDERCQTTSGFFRYRYAGGFHAPHGTALCSGRGNDCAESS